MRRDDAGSRCAPRDGVATRAKLHALITAQPRGRPPAAADARASSTVHASASSSPCADGTIVGCAELAPLSPHVAEVRSLVVDGARARQRRRRDARRRAAAARARAGFEKLCAFTHDARLFHPAWASRSCRTCGCRRKSSPTASTCPLFRRCGQYAMVAAARRGRATPTRRAAPRRRASTHERRATRSRRRRRRSPAASPTPRGFRAAGVSARHQGERRRSTWRSSSSDAPAHRGGRLHDQPRAGRAGRSCRASIWRAPAASRARDRRQQRLRQRLHRRRRACRSRARWPPRPRGCVGCPAEQVLVASTGVIGVALPIDKIRARPAGRVRARSARDQGAAAARAIMTTDPFPKEAAVARHDRRTRRRDRRHGQGLRHDRADDGDDARLRDDRRGGAAARCSTARCAKRSNDTFNAITVDGECSTNDCVMLLANGASGVDDRRGELRRVRRRRCARSACELALGIVRGGEGATKLVTVTVTGAASRRRRAARGEGDRQLAAREDGDSRRRSELGPADRRRRAAPASAFELVARRGHDRRRRAVQGRPAARRARAAGGASYLQGHGDHASRVDLGAGGARRRRCGRAISSAEYVRINAEYRT